MLSVPPEIVVAPVTGDGAGVDGEGAQRQVDSAAGRA